MSAGSPEKQILTRLFLAQRRLRFVRGVSAGLRWFGFGSLVAALGLVVLWNWDRLPGPWQWAATAGRPAELLWLPLLFGLGGFASRWLTTPSARETAYRLDRMRDTQERLLTAVDWIFSEKPRTVVSERLLGGAAQELADEARLRADLKAMERVPKKQYTLLASLTLPLLLLAYLPPHVGLPDSAAVWMGPNQVDRLAEQLARELEETRKLDQPEAKLKELLRKLQDEKDRPEADSKATDALKRELQQTADALKAMAENQESARELLETLAQRARNGEELSEGDKKALAELKKQMEADGHKEALEKAQSDWEKGDNAEAASQLEALQREAGQAAKDLKEMASQGQEGAQGENGPQDGQQFNEGQGEQQGQGQEFDEGQGDQHGQGQEFDEGQGDQHGHGQGEMPGEGVEGTGPGDFGRGSTEEEQLGQNASGRRSRRESDRTSDKTEEFKNLHAPIRSQEETSQTRVQGNLDSDGPRQRTRKQGRGMATSGEQSESGGALLRYQESAENAILREEIPPAHREEVRRYFETLDR